jgi:plasmid stabilization system protein ParE
MVKTVKITTRAKRRMNQMTAYLAQEYSHAAAVNLSKQADEVVKLAALHPLSGYLVNEEKNIRYLKMDKNRQMFYRLKGSTLIVLDFFDTRQNPDKRPF